MKDMTITIGNGGAKAEYSSTSVDVLLEDVMLGKIPLPPSAYDEGVRRATALINGDLNGNFQYMPDGVYGQDPDNPNHRTRYSISGLAYMTDGRQWNNALTFRGLTASAIYTGTLRADLIEILGANGNYRATGGVSTWTDPTDPTKFTRIDPKGTHINKGAFSLTGFDGRKVFFDGVMSGEPIANIQVFNTTYDGINTFKDNEEYSSMFVVRDIYKGRYLDISGVTRLVGTYSTDECQLDIRITAVGAGHDELFLQRETINGSAEPEDYSFRFRLDLQQLYGVVPDYRYFQFYVQVKLVNSEERHIASFRVNRGRFFG